MKALATAALALSFLATAATAEARLDRSTAYLVALRDAQERAGELGSTNSYSVPKCKRISERRIDCGVWAQGRDFEVDLEGSHYVNRKCTWTVVTRETRFYPYSRSFRKGIRCRKWTTESPLD